MGGARTDFNLTNKMKLFYRFNHDDNIGVTGFGGVGLSGFRQLQQRELSRRWAGTTVPGRGFMGCASAS